MPVIDMNKKLSRQIVDRKLVIFNNCCTALMSERIETARFNNFPKELQSVFETLMKYKGYRGSLSYFLKFADILNHLDYFDETYEPAEIIMLADGSQTFDEILLIGIRFVKQILEEIGEAGNPLEAVNALIHYWMHMIYRRAIILMRSAVYYFYDKPAEAIASFKLVRDILDDFFKSIDTYYKKYGSKLALPFLIMSELLIKKALILQCLVHFKEPVENELDSLQNSFEDQVKNEYHAQLKKLSTAVSVYNTPALTVTQEDGICIALAKKMLQDRKFEQASQLCDTIFAKVIGVTENQRKDTIWSSTCVVLNTEYMSLLTVLTDELSQSAKLNDPRFALCFRLIQQINVVCGLQGQDVNFAKLFDQMRANASLKLKSVESLYENLLAEEKAKLAQVKLLEPVKNSSVKKSEQSVTLAKKTQIIKTPPKMHTSAPIIPIEIKTLAPHPAMQNFMARVQCLSVPAEDFTKILLREREIQKLNYDFQIYIANKCNVAFSKEEQYVLSNKIERMQKNWHILYANQLSHCRKTINDRIDTFLQQNPKVSTLYTRLQEIAKIHDVEAPEIHYVGGFVRDIGLGKLQFRDIDFKVNFNLSLIKKELESEFINFGLFPALTLKWEGISIDITQFSVKVVNLSKADITHNAMSYTPGKGLNVDDKTVEDILLHRLRSPNPLKLAENPEHVMRIMYQASKTTDTIDTETLKQIKKIGEKCSTGQMHFALPKKRLSFELNKAMLHGNATAYFELLLKCKMVFALFPFLNMPKYDILLKKIINDLRELDRKVEQGIELIYPEDFYFILLRPAILSQVKKNQAEGKELRIILLMNQNMKILEGRVELQVEPYNVEAKLYQKLHQYCLNLKARLSSNAVNLQESVCSLRK